MLVRDLKSVDLKSLHRAQTCSHGPRYSTPLNALWEGKRFHSAVNHVKVIQSKVTKLSLSSLLQKNSVGVCGMLSETLNLFQIEICYFPYPISDLTRDRSA